MSDNDHSGEKWQWFAHEILVREPVRRGYLGRFFAEPADVDDTVQETYARIFALPEVERVLRAHPITHWFLEHCRSRSATNSASE